jgi:hypothetical protein
MVNKSLGVWHQPLTADTRPDTAEVANLLRFTKVDKGVRFIVYRGASSFV